MTTTIEQGQHHSLSWGQRLLLAALRGYQWFLSPLLGAYCRFHPSCSNYAIAAITQHGCWRGLWLTSGRLLRCNPCFSGGHDPVPEAKAPVRK